jgi:threonine synthase
MTTYISTRGQSPELSFENVVMAGLAPDGGLYVPKTVPTYSHDEWKSLQGLSYVDLALRIITPFVGNDVSETDLKKLLSESYAGFRHEAIAPLRQIGPNEWILELFHGPTLAFKDFALQFLGKLLHHILAKKGERVTVVGATSGDTGSAAIAGCRGLSNMDIFILHPKGRTSDVQRRQMTTVSDANVFNIAVEGTFDDCQDIVKAMFGDASFREQYKLVAVNSINWVRILAQVVYYAYSALALGAPGRKISFCVPTGNFGDIFAGYIASKMGLPIETLVIATNQNDILARCVATGKYEMTGVSPTLSPSMDIQISSNFERLLFDLYDRDASAIAGMMKTFRSTKILTLSDAAHTRLKSQFAAASVNDAETKRIIAKTYQRTGELLDPHTAVGIGAATLCNAKRETPMVTLATAHPAKFPDAVKAATDLHPPLPDHMKNLYDLPERFVTLPNDTAAIQQHIREHHVL